MGLKKSLGHLREDIFGYGPVTGMRTLWLKTRKPSAARPLHIAALGGRVWVRPGTTDLAILDQIALHPYMPIDSSATPACIVDLGANIGLSTRFLKQAYPRARVIAVEPDEGNFELLKKNTHGLLDVTCVQAAIWINDGSITLQTEGLGNSSFRAGSGPGKSVRAMTISTLMRENDVDRIGLLKIDIEGAEKDIFASSEIGWLSAVDRISVEVHDHFRPGATQSIFEALRSDPWDVQVYHGLLMCRRASR